MAPHVCVFIRGLKPQKHTERKTHMSENTLLTIYGARISKSGKHINLTLVSGEGDKKQFYTACVKIDESAKTHGSIEGDEAIIVVPLLHNNKEAPKDDLHFNN